MSSPTSSQGHRRLTHVQFSGIGGHLREFGTFSASQIADTEQSAIFLGNVEVAEDLARMATRANIPYVYVPKAPGAGLDAAWSVLVHLWRFRPDDILVRSLEAAPLAWLYRLLRPNSRLVVVETQCVPLKTVKQIWLSKFCMLTADCVVVLSESYRDELKSVCGRLFHENKVHIIPNGIDTSNFKPNPSKSQGEFRIGMQSRLAAVKDHPTLLRAFALLPKQLSDGRVPTLKIAGSGDQEDRLRRLCQDLEIESRVHFLGELSSDLLVEMMQDLDLYVQATHGESFCFSVMEALSVGLPVVTADLPVLNQTLANRSFVGLYLPGEEESLAQQILSFSEPAKLEVFGQQARDFALTYLDERTTREKYVRLFQTIAKS